MDTDIKCAISEALSNGRKQKEDSIQQIADKFQIDSHDVESIVESGIDDNELVEEEGYVSRRNSLA